MKLPYSNKSESVNQSIYLSVCLPVCLSICLSVYHSACLSVYLSACLSVCLPVCLPVCQTDCLSILTISNWLLLPTQTIPEIAGQKAFSHSPFTLRSGKLSEWPCCFRSYRATVSAACKKKSEIWSRSIMVSQTLIKATNSGCECSMADHEKVDTCMDYAFPQRFKA